MFYALNLFNIEDIETYRDYLTTAGPIVQELGGDLVVMGRRRTRFPFTSRERPRGWAARIVP